MPWDALLADTVDDNVLASCLIWLIWVSTDELTLSWDALLADTVDDNVLASCLIWLIWVSTDELTLSWDAFCVAKVDVSPSVVVFRSEIDL